MLISKVDGVTAISLSVRSGQAGRWLVAEVFTKAGNAMELTLLPANGSMAVNVGGIMAGELDMGVEPQGQDA